jgi:chitinase
MLCVAIAPIGHVSAFPGLGRALFSAWDYKMGSISNMIENIAYWTGFANGPENPQFIRNFEASQTSNEFATIVKDYPTLIKKALPAVGCEGNQTTPQKIVCYYPNWVHYRKGEGQYRVEHIKSQLCTHIVYAFVVLNPADHKIKLHDKWLDADNVNWSGNLGNLRKFTDLKNEHPDIKYLVALGGWNDSKKPKYSQLLADSAKRAAFVTHAVEFLQFYGFDGLDLDYEYPAYDGHGRDAPDSDKQGFTAWVRELRAAFDPHGFELTAAVSAAKSIIDNGYEVAEISKHLDAIHLMAYDLHGSWEDKTGHHATQFGQEGDLLTVDYAVKHWLKSGAPREKLVVGLPTYGRSFSLVSKTWNEDPTCHAINCPARGGSEAGPHSKTKGFLMYSEICKKIKNDGWTVVSDPDMNMGPYAYKGKNWVGYDDVAMLRVKARYIVDQKLGGAMFWDLPSDDFRGACGDGEYPLITAVSEIVKKGTTCSLR